MVTMPHKSAPAAYLFRSLARNRTGLDGVRDAMGPRVHATGETRPYRESSLIGYAYVGTLDSRNSFRDASAPFQ